jgi:hypothetical protein
MNLLKLSNSAPIQQRLLESFRYETGFYPVMHPMRYLVDGASCRLDSELAA